MKKEDDSFKYLGHETLAELVAELRNKMGSVTQYVDLLELMNDPKNYGIAQRLLPNAEETLIKSLPLILRYLKEFEQYDLNIIKDTGKHNENKSVIERNGSHVHLKMGNTEKLRDDFNSSGSSSKV